MKTARVAPFLFRRLSAGGTTGNERLTAATGILLLVLLGALGVTILRIRPLLNVHMFLGLLLIPPIMLKMASTGYRFIRYYTSNPRYRRKGPPEAIMRLIAPFVVASTVVVFASGVVLLLIGPSSRGPLLTIHKASFFLWIGFTGVHVLGHLPHLRQVMSARPENEVEWRAQAAGRGGRFLSLAGAVVAGVVLAILLVPLFASWMHGYYVLSDH